MLELLLAVAIATTTPTPTEEPTPPPPLECPVGTVPGWLDEAGQPTSCVSDDPCPETEEYGCPEVVTPPPVIETPVVTSPPANRDALAETGPATWWTFPLATVLLVGGAACVLASTRRKVGA